MPLPYSELQTQRFRLICQFSAFFSLEGPLNWLPFCYLAGGYVSRQIGGAAHALQETCKGGYRVLPFGGGDRCTPCDNGPWVEGFTEYALIPASSPARARRTPGGQSSMSHNEPVSPCFTPGTLIATDRGQRPVETLRRGDKVVTRDNGLQRIYWVGRRDLSFGALGKSPGLQPILVRAGALGEGLPSRDMLVSPNHRFLRELNPIAGETRGQVEEVLVAARHLVDHRRVTPANSLGVSYIHILCSRHQVILANGAWTESFHPDDRVMRALETSQRKELTELFPDIETIGASAIFPPARKIIESRSRFEL